MKNKVYFISIILLIQIVFLSNSYGELENSHNDEINVLLQDENKSKFLTNERGQDFHDNFRDLGKLAIAENNILIKKSTSVRLDGDKLPEFSTIFIEGELEIINTDDSALRVQKIIIAHGGKLTIGTEELPIKSDDKVEIEFVNRNSGEIGIFVFGELFIHGRDIGPSFAKIITKTKSGGGLIVSEDVWKWNVGNQVIITSPGDKNCNEQSVISRIDGKNIFFKNPLFCSHKGSLDDNNNIGAHIALLDRNVKFSSVDLNNRASVNFFHDSFGYIKFAEFDKLGPKDVLGRYPIHFHHMKDTSRGIEVVGNSITNSDNRWITIHDSNGILVKNNVGYNSVGHGFFLEDGNEFENIFEKNLGIETKRGKLIKSDSGSSVFWTMNPMNTFRDNVAVNGHYWGFNFEIPNKEVYVPMYNKTVNLRSLPSSEFNNNVAYNFLHGGMHILRPSLYNDSVGSNEIIISNLFVKSSHIETTRHWGVKVLGSDITILNSVFNNNLIGIDLLGSRNKVVDTEINIDRDFKTKTKISGILIQGRDNLIENSEIEGYYSTNKNFAADISISTNEKLKNLISATIVNTTLYDPQPIFFGDAINDESFLEFYETKIPNSNIKHLPKNFILKKINSGIPNEKDEYNNYDFLATIKEIDNIQLDKFDSPSIEKILEQNKKTYSEIIKDFKTNSIEWKNNVQSDQDFLDEIEILLVSGIIEINGVEPYTFGEIDFVISNWVKILVVFWSDDSISDQEFVDAIEFILELQIETEDYSYK